MSLSFNCPHCNAGLVVQYLKPGETCKCNQCGKECTVPVDAQPVDKSSNIVYQTTMSSPPPPPTTMQPAGRGARLAARLIDAFLVLPLFLFWFMISAITDNDAGAMLGFAIFIIGVIGLIAYQWYLLSVQGQTIGKRMVDIKIVKLDESNGGFVTNVLLREIVNGLIGIVPFYGLVDILFIFSEERRCIHDHIAGTRVVKV